ncbi:MAG TPA: serine/threonine-protein kinase [Roseiflexaceae bacterium]|nr:serine/threonine-protein kinase [Roseiflexaceae bacterium]
MALIKKPGTTKGIAASQPTPDTNAELDPQGTTTPGAAKAAAPVMQPGVVLQGRYTIEGTLGVGGMSVVYRGRDMRFKEVVRPCAIKEMYQSAPDSGTRLLNLKNFERESGLLATLTHPAIPKVYDFFEENGRVYLILELIPGQDLETVLDEAGGPIDERRVLHWAVQLCDVLTYLHQQQPEPIVFRDLKPSNIMVTENDRIVLIDFGIARGLVRADKKGTVIGTEGYSPPEQYRGVAEPGGDIYALGATLHHLLTASDPRLETPFTFHERPLRQFNPALSDACVAIVERALEYDMTARWQSAAEMREALMAALGQAPAGATRRAAAQVAAAPRSSQTELVWKFKCEDEVRSSPCIANGMVYVGCYDTNIYAVGLERGDFRWKYATEGGISSSPAFWQDMVYIGSEDGAVYALDGRRGTLRWSFRTGKPVRSSPRIDERIVFVGSDDQHLYAIDGLRGTLIWKYRTWMPIRSSAAMDSTSVYFGGGDGYVYAVALKNGAILWKQRTQQPVISSPTCVDGIVYVGSMDNQLYALDSEGGWPVWKFRTGHYVNSSPAFVDGRVYVGSVDGALYCIDAKNGRQVWKYETDSQITSSPRVENGRIYFGAADGFIYALESGGSLAWKYETGGPVVSSPTINDGVIYIGSMDQHLYALRA